MSNLTIMPYNYNARCDTNRCTNRALISIGVKGESPGTYHNLCNECLEAIVHHAPIHMILDRTDVQEKIKETAEQMLFNATQVDASNDTDITTIKRFDGDPFIEDEEKLVDELKEMQWADLRNLAKELEIEGYNQMKRTIVEEKVAEELEKKKDGAN